jgi:hypothetical protein
MSAACTISRLATSTGRLHVVRVPREVSLVSVITRTVSLKEAAGAAKTKLAIYSIAAIGAILTERNITIFFLGNFKTYNLPVLKLKCYI